MKFELIDGWKKFYAMYSIWFFAILGLLPDLFNLAVDQHLLDSAGAPAMLVYATKVMAFIGAASRLVKQKVLEVQAETAQSNTPTN